MHQSSVSSNQPYITAATEDHAPTRHMQAVRVKIGKRRMQSHMLRLVAVGGLSQVRTSAGYKTNP